VHLLLKFRATPKRAVFGELVVYSRNGCSSSKHKSALANSIWVPATAPDGQAVYNLQHSALKIFRETSITTTLRLNLHLLCRWSTTDIIHVVETGLKMGIHDYHRGYCRCWVIGRSGK
jgi:hypothetical protein